METAFTGNVQGGVCGEFWLPLRLDRNGTGCEVGRCYACVAAII